MGIRIELSHIRQDDEFAVCLTKAPDLPGKASSVVQKKFGVNIGVVGCTDWLNKEEGWSWCSFESDEKEAIGQKLLDIDARLDEWYFCLMYKE